MSELAGNPGVTPGEGAGAKPPALCLGCGDPLTNRRKGAKYHDDKCRDIGRRNRNRSDNARNCVICDSAFQSVSKRRLYCSDSCRSKARTPYRPFVTLDGEGENLSDGSHVYTLLADSTGRWIGTKKGLSTEECLDFLLTLPRGSHGGTRPIYTWFAFDYDVNMMLGDIPLKGDNSIEQLKRTNKIWWQGYSITYIRRKILRIAYGTRRHTSYDVWGFFQSNFELALQDWGLEVPPIITEGKEARGGFSNWTLRRIRQYNQAELDLLATLCERLRDSIAPLSLPIQSWHGPAALAAAWLRKNNVKQWMGSPDSLPPTTFTEVCARAYFGGRIDVLGYGIVNPVYHYDIISAYPASIAKLPNLTKLTWKRQGKGLPKAGGLYVSRIRWRIPQTYWAPFPWRSRNGTIRYPLEGEGWYWFPEVEMAIAKYGKGNIQVIESWVAVGEIEYPFHDLIHKTFAYRKELKRKGQASHFAVKLILNSLYGKFAQTVGKASYYSPIWAGLVTSHTRAQLMGVISDDVVCVMTDSIWSTKPLDISLTDALGGWEKQDETRLVLAEAGLYQATNADGISHTWQRGFDKRNPVDVQELVTQWLYQDDMYSPTYRVLRFIGMGLATTTKAPWRRWIEFDRKIESVPLAGTTKRLPFLPTVLPRKSGNAPNFQRLLLRARDSQEISAAYSKLTLDLQLTEERLQDECEE